MIRSVPSTSSKPLPSTLHVDEARCRVTLPSSPRISSVDTAYSALAALLVRGGDPEEHRVGRPRLARDPLLPRLRHDLEAGHRARTLAVRGADAVGAGVAAADDDDVLALGA